RTQNEHLLEAREALEAERQRYHDLFEFAPDAYLLTDPQGRIQEANRAAGELLRTRPHQLTGKPLIVFIPLDERRAFRERLEALSREGARQEWETRLMTRRLSPLDVSVTVAPASAGGGPVAGLRWLLRDVTARKQAERLAAIGQMVAGLA